MPCLVGGEPLPGTLVVVVLVFMLLLLLLLLLLFLVVLRYITALSVFYTADKESGKQMACILLQ